MGAAPSKRTHRLMVDHLPCPKLALNLFRWLYDLRVLKSLRGTCGTSMLVVDLLELCKGKLCGQFINL